ncbi:MAG: alcohol dehydrogenase catalytic domain-containing protein [Chloroflexi bacterium]|nr:alcohol dehydrogenase catalytic domain-containing protein [Chloroflexota bacterium]
MKTAMFYGEKDIRVEEIADPVPGPGEVLVRIRSAGICGSDLHNYRGNRPRSGDVPWRQGHELAGEVVALGSGVNSLAIGQRVAIEAKHLLGCGNCRECRSGNYHICATRGIRNGVRQASFGFSELDVVVQENARPIPDHVSFDGAALLDCYAVSVHAAHIAPAGPDDTVVVLGAGTIGITMGQVAKAFGAGRVIMVSTRREPLQVALEMNATDEIVVTSEVDPIESVMHLTDEDGAAVIYETVGGNEQLIAQCMSMARMGGAVCIIGSFTRPQQIPADLAMQRELSLLWSNSYSSFNGVSEQQTALDLMSRGLLDVSTIVTHRYPLDAILEAFSVADDKRTSGAIKVIVSP